jgi:hypothetical protein
MNEWVYVQHPRRNVERHCQLGHRSENLKLSVLANVVSEWSLFCKLHQDHRWKTLTSASRAHT